MRLQEALEQRHERVPRQANAPEAPPPAMPLVEIIRSLGQDYDPLWGSLVKQTMRRVHPGFNESYYGYKNFSDMLHRVADLGVIELEHDQERGNYKITLKDD